MNVVRPRCIAALLAAFSLVPLAQSQPFQFNTLAGGAGMPGNVDATNTQARFGEPAGIAVTVAGKVFLSDPNAVRMVSPVGNDWVVSTIAGVRYPHGTNDGWGTNAAFNYNQGLAVDTSGNVFVADTYNDTIRRVTPVGGAWYVTTLTGGIGASGASDGTNAVARFNNPYGIAVSSAGDLFVADTGNETIRKIVPAGTNWVVTTIAGAALSPGTNDGTGSLARFRDPAAIAVDNVGALYVADFSNHTLRKLVPAGTNWVVTTLAGAAGLPGSADGLGSAARFRQPAGVAVDGAGYVYVADYGNDTIRRVTPGGVVSTIGGLAGTAGAADGVGAGARFNSPSAVAVDAQGRIYVGDSLNYTVRSGWLAPWLQTAVAPGQVVISWSSGLTNYFLERCDDPSIFTLWSRVTNVALDGDYFRSTNRTELNNALFRLHQSTQ